MDSLAGPEAAVMKGPRLDELAELMVSLPQRFGGAGFTRGERVADAAFLASFALIWAQVLRLFPGVITSGMLTDAVPGVGRLGEVKRARERLVQEEEEVHALVGDIEVLPAGVTRGRIDIPTFEEMVQGPIKGLQRRLASIPATLDGLRLRALALQGGPRTRAWYHSVASADSVACDFWRVIPSYQAMQVLPAHFSIAARSYLLQSQPVMVGLRSCLACQHGVDTEGMHFLACRPLKEWGLGNPFSAVHDPLVREVASALRKVYPGSGRVKVEVRTTLTRGHRQDITVLNHDGQDGQLMVEVSVIRTLCDDHLMRAAEGEALVHHERVRRRDYEDLPAGATMVPFVCDVLGGVGPETARFVRRLAADMRDRGEVVRAGAPTWEELLKRNVSMVLAKTRAQAMHRRAEVEQRGGHP
jgi:hypothetical protein